MGLGWESMEFLLSFGGGVLGGWILGIFPFPKESARVRISFRKGNRILFPVSTRPIDTGENLLSHSGGEWRRPPRLPPRPTSSFSPSSLSKHPSFPPFLPWTAEVDLARKSRVRRHRQSHFHDEERAPCRHGQVRMRRTMHRAAQGEGWEDGES